MRGSSAENRLAKFRYLVTCPPLWDLPKLAVHEPIRKQRGEVIGQASGFFGGSQGANRIEVHEPGFEQPPGNGFEFGGKGAVVVDAVVE